MTQWVLWAFNAIASLIPPFAFKSQVKQQGFASIALLFQVDIILLTLVISRWDNYTFYSLLNRASILGAIWVSGCLERK